MQPDASDDLPPMTPSEEAEMQAEIDRAIAPYRAITPPAVLAMMRENLEHALRTHPAPRAYMRSFVRRPEVAASTEIPRSGEHAQSGRAGVKERS